MEEVLIGDFIYMSGVKNSRKICKDICLAVLLPELAAQWHPTLNGDLTPYDFTCGVGKKVWWLCEKGHEWDAFISNRTKGKGCPCCSGRRACEDNCVATLRPDIAAQWHPTLNGTLTPHNFTCNSHKKAWWLCSKCGESWFSVIYSRCGGGSKCPYCSGHRVCNSNCLSTLRPDLAAQWHSTLNSGLTPDDVSVGSGSKVWWVCNKCGNEWRSFVYHRTKDHNCPKCSKGNVSPVSQKWLDSLNIPVENREYFLPDLKIKVDAFVPETNTVYEFFGDYWHGNPESFDKNKEHPVCKKTFGKLYEEAKTRISRLKEAGYKVVYVWENDFRKSSG